VELPAQIQPGQHPQVVAIAVGYGRKGTDRFSKIGPRWIQGKPTVMEGETVGKNAFPLGDVTPVEVLLENVVSIAPTGRKAQLAHTQTHHSITVPEELGGQRRDVVRETTLAAFLKDPASGNPPPHEAQELWPNDHKHEGHHW